MKSDSKVTWKKTLGQHLLHDGNILRKIVDTVDPAPGGRVIEVGCGSGALTEQLLDRDIILTGVEIDKQFYDILEEKFGERDNFTLVKDNVLKTDLCALIPEGESAILTGNLPYNVTSQILFHVFETKPEVTRITILIQKEVAQRMAARIRTKDRGILSLVCQYHGKPRLNFTVSRNCFFPKPKVDSAVVTIDMDPTVDKDYFPQFLKVVKTTFGKRRKRLGKSLLDLPEADVAMLEKSFDLNRRPEELEVSEYFELAKMIFV